ncbi:MAG: insulinase family protein [Nitrospirota bacterium]|nr:insulinase family protein [Nitrospirota bacterium]
MSTAVGRAPLTTGTRRGVSILCLLLATACATTPDPRHMRFEPVAITEPQIHAVTLDNGLRLYLLPDASLPLVKLYATVGVGLLHTPRETTGMGAMLGRLLRDGGAGAFTPDTLDTDLDARAILLGSGADDETFHVHVNTLSRNLPVALERFADVLRRPRFDADRFQMARGAMMEAVRRRNDTVQQVLRRQFARQLYGDSHPRAWEMDTHTLEAVNREQLVAFHQHYFQPRNTTIGVVGDFEVEPMVAMLRKVFGDWQAGDALELPAIPALPDSGPRRVVVTDKEPDQASILVGQVTLDRKDPDYHLLRLAVTILGGDAFTSRLFQEVRSRQGLAYSVSAALMIGESDRGTFVMSASTGPENAGAVVGSMLDEVHRMAREPVPQAELDAARDIFLNRFVFNSDTPDKVLLRRVYLDRVGLPADEIQRMREAVIRATPEDLRRVVATHLDADRMLVVSVGDAKRLEQQLSGFGPVIVMPLEEAASEAVRVGISPSISPGPGQQP